MTSGVVSGGDYRFDLDISKGQVAERLIADILCHGTSGTTIEVKRDYKVSSTGNVAIEYRSRGKLSGIATSEADWWAIALSGPAYDNENDCPEVVVLIRKDRLKRILRMVRDAGKLRCTTGGDDGTSEMALLHAIKLLTPMVNCGD